MWVNEREKERVTSSKEENETLPPVETDVWMTSSNINTFTHNGEPNLNRKWRSKIRDQSFQLVGANEFMASQWASLFVDLSNFLLVLNCSSNFWVFLVWGKRFRQSCRRLLVSTSLGMALYKAVNRSEPVSYHIVFRVTVECIAFWAVKECL